MAASNRVNPKKIAQLLISKSRYWQAPLDMFPEDTQVKIHIEAAEIFLRFLHEKPEDFICLKSSYKALSNARDKIMSPEIKERYQNIMRTIYIESISSFKSKPEKESLELASDSYKEARLTEEDKATASRTYEELMKNEDIKIKYYSYAKNFPLEVKQKYLVAQINYLETIIGDRERVDILVQEWLVRRVNELYSMYEEMGLLERKLIIANDLLTALESKGELTNRFTIENAVEMIGNVIPDGDRDKADRLAQVVYPSNPTEAITLFKRSGNTEMISFMEVMFKMDEAEYHSKMAEEERDKTTCPKKK